MSRLTVERVRAAYEKTGRKPIRFSFDKDGGSCGLGAVSLAEIGTVLPNSKALGLPETYAGCFVYGFDGGGLDGFDPVARSYVADGQAAAEAVGL